jgi:hypothetical protein
MCVHVFGAPCLYSPMEGAVHKRAAQTLEGFYVGTQHPMVLVLRKSDMKLISVSKKKLVLHESCYVAPLSYSLIGFTLPLSKAKANLRKKKTKSNISQRRCNQSRV